MQLDLKIRDIVILIFSIVSIYFLAPILDRQMGVFVSISFALLLILSSKMSFDQLHLRKYALYILIAAGTYYILFNDQPWDFLTQGGIYESSALPLIVTSIIMSVNGWLLLTNRHERILYSIITLGIQIPIALAVSSPSVQSLFMDVSFQLNYHEHYALSIQLWQFEWMMNYFLGIYLLRHIK